MRRPVRQVLAGAVGLLLGISQAWAGSAAPFMWEVKGTKATHYLIGSVHMLPESAHPLPPGLDEAYAATRGLVLEADIDDLGSPEFQTRLLAAARDDRAGGLKSRIGDKLYATLQARAVAMGAPAPICDGFRAWFCAVTLELMAMQRAGFNPELGIDQHFFARARDDGRPVLGLETAEEQGELFIGLDEKQSVAMLASTLDEITSGSQDPLELLRLWRDADLPALEKILKELRQQHPLIHARMISDRNRAWVPDLLPLFAGAAPQMVIVGAAHLPGPDGLLALLKARGLSISPAQ